MQTITVNITSGNWTIETAVVQLKEGTIVGVELGVHTRANDC